MVKREMPRYWRGMEARKIVIAMGDCIKSDIERVEEYGGKLIDRRNWTLLTKFIYLM